MLQVLLHDMDPCHPAAKLRVHVRHLFEMQQASVALSSNCVPDWWQSMSYVYSMLYSLSSLFVFVHPSLYP